MDRLATLGLLWSAWEEHGRTMTGGQWEGPTRLDAWNVRSLYVHVAMWPFGFSTLISRVQDAEPTHATAAALMREFNRPDGIARSRADQIAADAQRAAASYRTAQAIEQFASTGPQAIAIARRLGPVVVDYFGLARLRLDEAVSIGIVETTVHLLDLQRALGLPPDVPGGGLAHTAAVLTEMAPPVDFIEAATGRTPADLFPVLS